MTDTETTPVVTREATREELDKMNSWVRWYYDHGQPVWRWHTNGNMTLPIGGERTAQGAWVTILRMGDC